MGLRDIFYSRTKFEASGWDADEVDDYPEVPFLAAPSKHLYPRKLDFRDMCVKTSNQDNSPHCTGYSTAGFIEIQNWKKNHYPEQVDGDAIYFEAKKLDGRPNVMGSWIRYAVKGAMNLGLIEGNPKRIKRHEDDVKCAIHMYGACIAGFNITNEWNMVNANGVIKKLPNNKVRSKGGHAVLICGYSQYGVYIQNSWGDKWGLHGFGLLSWEQVRNQLMVGMVIES